MRPLTNRVSGIPVTSLVYDTVYVQPKPKGGIKPLHPPKGRKPEPHYVPDELGGPRSQKCHIPGGEPRRVIGFHATMGNRPDKRGPVPIDREANPALIVRLSTLQGPHTTTRGTGNPKGTPGRNPRR